MCWQSSFVQWKQLNVVSFKAIRVSIICNYAKLFKSLHIPINLFFEVLLNGTIFDC